MSGPVGSVAGSPQLKIDRLYEWLSPVTSFKLKVLLPSEVCAERLCNRDTTWVREWVAGIDLKSRLIESYSNRSYCFWVVSTSQQIGQLKAVVFLNDSDGSTAVSGNVHARHRSEQLIFTVITWGIGLLVACVLALGIAGESPMTAIILAVLFTAAMIGFGALILVARRSACLSHSANSSRRSSRFSPWIRTAASTRRKSAQCKANIRILAFVSPH